MIPAEITAEHVRAAIAEIDRSGVPSARESAKYHVVYLERRYPPKYLVSLAAKHAIGRELQSGDFNGGIETNTFLQRLGFDVENVSVANKAQTTHKAQGNPPVVLIESASATVATAPRRSGQSITDEASESTGKHNERCQACKSTIRALLRKLYGAAEERKTFQIGATVDAFKASSHLSQLREIFAALEQERGFVGFVRTANLPPSDFFMPDPGFIVEFDESQHFTALRQLALSRYPASLPLGFDRQKWVRLCQDIQARDNDPAYRDEQRAWYDTLRDFLPSVFRLRPTVRLYACEYPWCKLSPDAPQDMERFRQIVSERAHIWAIGVENTRCAKFGRLVMDGAWTGDPNAARALLCDVAVALGPNRHLSCLCTCGAFLRFDWPRELPCRGNRDPDTDEINVLTAAAASTVWSVLTEAVVTRLGACFDHLTIGIDTKKDKVSTTYNIINEAHAELVCLVDLRKRKLHWTGKFYPTPQQERKIVRFPDLQSHFVRLDGDPVMILGCHDLSVYSQRGQAVAGLWRRQVARDFRRLAMNQSPVAVLHHPHTTVKCGTWRQQWRSIENELPSVRHYLGTGAYSYWDNGWEYRNDIATVMIGTRRGEIVDIIVRLALSEKATVPLA